MAKVLRLPTHINRQSDLLLFPLAAPEVLSALIILTVEWGTLLCYVNPAHVDGPPSFCCLQCNVIHDKRISQVTVYVYSSIYLIRISNNTQAKYHHGPSRPSYSLHVRPNIVPSSLVGSSRRMLL